MLLKKTDGTDGAHSEDVNEIVPNARHKRNARLFCRRPVCRLNKQGAWLNLDVGEFVQKNVIEVETEHVSRNKEETHLHLT